MTHLLKGRAAHTSLRRRPATAGSRSLLCLALTAALGAGCTPTTATEDPVVPGTGGSKATGGNSSTGGSGTAQGGTQGSSGGQTGSGGSGVGSGGQSGGSGGGSGGSVPTGSGGTAGGSSGSSGGAGGGTATDGAAADTPVSSGTSGCEGVTSKWCSDFEMQTAGGAPNGNGDFTVSGAVTIDGAKAFSGTKSLHYKPGGKSQIKFTKQFPMTEQHGRLMLFVLKTPPNPSHWDIVQTNSTAGNIWSWGGMYGKFELVVDPPDDGKDSSTPVPDGKWICMQWHFGPGTGGKSEYHVKMDGAEVNQSPVIGHWKAGMWKDLMVGWEVFGSAPIEFWIDDLAFGETAIPCPAAK
jgi:hypothetical protein